MLMQMDDTKLFVIVFSLWDRFGREPTEDEVYDFINGDEERREQIWNSIYTPTNEKRLGS